jgi:hypothetical protein
MSRYRSMAVHSAASFTLLALIISPASGQQDAATPSDAAAAEAPAVTMPQTPAPTMTGYSPPNTSKKVAPDVEARPLLQALRTVGNEFSSTWTQLSSQELGTDTIPAQYAQFYQKELVAQLMEDFKEGYVQVFVEVPKMLQMTAVEMSSPESASEFHRISMETLQSQLDQTNNHEEGQVTIIREEHLDLQGFDRATEKRYDLTIGELNPTRFYTLFGVAGPYMINATFLQMDVDPADAHRLFEAVAAGVMASGTLADAAATD